MNIEEIALKMELLERQNLSKSAEITNYTQSALTAKVKKMEREIGQDVFKRTPQGLKLTEVGQHYLQFLKKVAEQYEDFLHTIGPTQTSILVGTSHTTIKIYGPSIMNALQTSRSPIDVDFTVESSTALNHKVHLAEIDCALTSNPIKHYSDLHYDVLATETFEVISSSAHIIDFEQRTPVTLLVLSKGCMYTHALAQWLTDKQVPFTMKEIKSVSSILDFLEIEHTLAVLNTKLLALYPCPDLHFYDLDELHSAIETVYIYKKDDSKQPFILQLKQVIESLLEQN